MFKLEINTLENIKNDVQAVIDNWGTGDLGGAVTGLHSTLDAIKELIERAENDR